MAASYGAPVVGRSGMRHTGRSTAEWGSFMRVGISAAAIGACVGAALFLALAVGGPTPGTAAPAPLVQVTAKELRLSQPLAAMDAEGKGVAFAFCNQLLGVW